MRVGPFRKYTEFGIPKFKSRRVTVSSNQHSETNVMQFLLNVLRIKGLDMFRALLAHPQEALYKRHLVYCIRVMSVGCYRDWSGTGVRHQFHSNHDVNLSCHSDHVMVIKPVKMFQFATGTKCQYNIAASCSVRMGIITFGIKRPEPTTHFSESIPVVERRISVQSDQILLTLSTPN
jgi:hypothetical protein